MTTESPPQLTTAFQGFDIPRQNWFKMPNNWTDITAEITTIAELKVVEYVLKHTWGYQEYGVRKRITSDEFMHGRKRKDGIRIDKGTGLSKPSVIAGLKTAVERGLLIEEVDDSDKARVKKYYSLRMLKGLSFESAEDDAPSRDPDDSGGESRGVKDLNAGVKILYPEVKTFYPRGKDSLPRTEKDTLVRQQEKEQYNNNPPEKDNSVVVVALAQQGIAEKLARSYAQEHTDSYIREKIDFLEFLLETTPERVRNPRGWLRTAIEDNFGPPDGYKPRAEREAEALARQEREQESLRQAELFEQQLQIEQERKAQEHEQHQQGAEERLAQIFTHYGTGEQEKAIWQEVLAELKKGLPSFAFQAFLINSYLLTTQNGKAVIGFQNGFMRDQVVAKYAALIKRTLANHLQQPKVTLELVSLDKLPQAGNGVSG